MKKLTKAQIKLLYKTGIEGVCRLVDDRQHKTHGILIDRGLLMHDADSGWILSEEGIAVFRKRWPDEEPEDPGNPFAGELHGLTEEIVEAAIASYAAEERFNSFEPLGDRPRREKQVIQRIATALNFPGKCVRATRRVFRDGSTGFTVEVNGQFGPADKPSRDVVIINRAANIRTKDELMRFIDAVQALILVSEMVVTDWKIGVPRR